MVEQKRNISAEDWGKLGLPEALFEKVKSKGYDNDVITTNDIKALLDKPELIGEIEAALRQSLEQGGGARYLYRFIHNDKNINAARANLGAHPWSTGLIPDCRFFGSFGLNLRRPEKTIVTGRMVGFGSAGKPVRKVRPPGYSKQLHPSPRWINPSSYTIIHSIPEEKKFEDTLLRALGMLPVWTPRDMEIAGKIDKQIDILILELKAGLKELVALNCRSEVFE